MPNRILKESVCSSPSVDALTWFEEVFFYRLIVNCDDYGRFDARPEILKARLFPLRDVRKAQIEDALAKLAAAGMARVYAVDRQPYLQLLRWGRHQSIRNKRSRYPDDPDDPPAVASDCMQMSPGIQSVSVSVSESESESQSEHESEPAGAGEARALIVAHLNQRCGTSFRPDSAKTARLIEQRLREGYTVADMKAVVDARAADWGERPDMAVFLRPETLFGEKFEGYLSAARAAPAKRAPPGKRVAEQNYAQRDFDPKALMALFSDFSDAKEESDDANDD